MTVLTRRALNRALLHRQLLLRRWKLSPSQAVERLVGLQAQATNPPYYGLWTRLDGFERDKLSALITNRKLVRIVLMRSTLHLVTASDCLALRPTLQPMLDRAFAHSAWLRGLDGVDLDEVAKLGRELVEHRPLSNADLGAELAKTWPDRDPNALVQVIRTKLPIVQLPPRGIWGVGGQPTGTTAEAWLKSPLSPIAPDDLVLRYLAAFGPAGVRDAQTWSGLTRLGEVFDRLRPRLRTFADDNGVELFDLPRAARPDPDTPAPVRFLPEYDNTLLSFADRSRIIAEQHRPRVFTNNGQIHGTVLVDGFVAATWKLGRAGLTVTPFGRLGHRDEIEAEGERLKAFAGFAGSATKFAGC